MDMCTALAAALLFGALPLGDDPKTGATGAAGTGAARFAGPTADGFLLPNGWHLTPVGTHVPTTDLPLNILALPDNRRALIASSGYNDHDLALVDLCDPPRVIARATVRQSWFGLAVSQDQSKVWWAGGGDGRVHTFDLKGGALTPTDRGAGDLTRMTLADIVRQRPDAARLTAEQFVRMLPTLTDAKSFKSGLALDERHGILYSLDINAGSISAVPLNGRQATRTEVIGGRPYDVVIDPRGTLLYVSDWAGMRVLVLDPSTLKVQKKIGVGAHPNQMALHPRDGRLFVACASSNGVSVIDTARGQVAETIFTSLFPRAPAGSTPCALAVAPDGQTLYVANADNNCVAVIDVGERRQSQVKGFIPTGWYPTAVAVTPDGKNVLIGVGKGLQSKANPVATGQPAADRRRLPFPYIGTTLSGALSVVPVPDEAKLKEYTARVYRNCPYSDDQLMSAPHAEATPIPTKVGDPSPVQFVIYVIKENRTYDQVFGDLAAGPNPKGNGDPSLCMFPRKVTPNHHKLAEEFVLLDNLYCNGQVSRDGHPWSTMAYHTDYIARDWHLTYSHRKGVDDDDEGNLQAAPSGYLWDACKRAGVRYRSYGEYGTRVSDGQGGLKMEGRVPGLVGHTCPNYGVSRTRGARARDPENVATFIREYDEFVKKGTMPRFIVMSLGEDHTEGTRLGAFTPQACVASNDLALGRLVEHVSSGPLWKETAIFVIEDDAQNGPDHVDAHRTVGLVISPFAKRRFVDSTQYATVSMIRTMELILGLPPLSQYDAAARPMFQSFRDTPDVAPYQHVPAQIDLDVTNDRTAYGADRSLRMDFSEYDKVDDFELNDILWHAVMGQEAPLPPAVRRAIAFRSQRPK
jgi:YVTN family beta-propeller protein